MNGASPATAPRASSVLPPGQKEAAAGQCRPRHPAAPQPRAAHGGSAPTPLYKYIYINKALVALGGNAVAPDVAQALPWQHHNRMRLWAAAPPTPE